MTSTTPDGQFFGPTIAGTGPDKDGGIMNAPDSDSTDNAEIIADESRA